MAHNILYHFKSYILQYITTTKSNNPDVCYFSKWLEKDANENDSFKQNSHGKDSWKMIQKFELLLAKFHSMWLCILIKWISYWHFKNRQIMLIIYVIYWSIWIVRRYRINENKEKWKFDEVFKWETKTS